MSGDKPGTAWDSLMAMIDDYRETSYRSEKTLRFYTESVRVVIKTLEEGGRHTLPWEIEPSDVRYLLKTFEDRGLTVATRRGYISAMRAWTKYYGSDVVESMELRWPADMRPTVDWLTQNQARALLALPMTPAQELVVHCELCLGLRRIEVLRLRPESFNDERRVIDVLGKGSMGGKPRLVPYHTCTQAVFKRYTDYRDTMVALARMRDPEVEVPAGLLIWERGGKLHEYGAKGSGIDAMIAPLGDAIGVHFSNHTLRRTFARTLYESGADIVAISKIMGHESTTMTLRYIGADLDEMVEAMRLYSL